MTAPCCVHCAKLLATVKGCLADVAGLLAAVNSGDCNGRRKHGYDTCPGTALGHECRSKNECHSDTQTAETGPGVAAAATASSLSGWAASALRRRPHQAAASPACNRVFQPRPGGKPVAVYSGRPCTACSGCKLVPPNGWAVKTDPLHIKGALNCKHTLM